jgi:hypothetical protein
MDYTQAIIQIQQYFSLFSIKSVRELFKRIEYFVFLDVYYGSTVNTYSVDFASYEGCHIFRISGMAHLRTRDAASLDENCFYF